MAHRTLPRDSTASPTAIPPAASTAVLLPAEGNTRESLAAFVRIWSNRSGYPEIPSIATDFQETAAIFPSHLTPF